MSSSVSNITPAPDPTELAPGHFTASSILNNVFNEILQMTTSLQYAAAAQANRLTFLTNWQQAYTNLIGEVHTFIKGGNDALGEDTSNNTTARSDLNNLNSNLIQTMQNRQSVISDDAKALQSNINQSNDAVNQQSDLGTAIIQELSTLLSAIYH